MVARSYRLALSGRGAASSYLLSVQMQRRARSLERREIISATFSVVHALPSAINHEYATSHRSPSDRCSLTSDFIRVHPRNRPSQRKRGRNLAQPQLKNGRIFSYRFPAPIPLTRCRSSAALNGRASIMRSAMDGPIPGTFSSSVNDAVLTSSLV